MAAPWIFQRDLEITKSWTWKEPSNSRVAFWQKIHVEGSFVNLLCQILTAVISSVTDACSGEPRGRIWDSQCLAASVLFSFCAAKTRSLADLHRFLGFPFPKNAHEPLLRRLLHDALNHRMEILDLSDQPCSKALSLSSSQSRWTRLSSNITLKEKKFERLKLSALNAIGSW